MKVVILGAGTLGKYLAATFCYEKNDVVLIDTSAKTLQRIKDKLDVMTIVGDGGLVSTLKEAGIKSADMFIAASNSDATNIHACQVANHFGVRFTLCRLLSTEYFSEEDGLKPAKLGIDHITVPQEECVQKVIDVLDDYSILEKILFSVPNALITAFKVLEDTPFANLKLRDFPDRNLISSVRLSTIIRDGKLMAPKGETVVKPGDEVYVAGPKNRVDEMIKWANPQQQKISKVVVAGGTRLGTNLAYKLDELGYSVRLIEEDFHHGETILNDLNTNMMVINGEPNDRDVLEEAGVSACDAFIAAQDDDENNILSCLLAKKMGAKKVITFTNKEEYIDLIPGMKMIDCGFSRRLVAVNSILRYILSDSVHTDAVIQRADASVSEFKVNSDSPICNKKIDECDFPPETVLSLVFRGGEVLSPSGDLTLLEGDLVAAVATKDTIKQLEALFNKKGIFKL